MPLRAVRHRVDGAPAGVEQVDRVAGEYHPQLSVSRGYRLWGDVESGGVFGADEEAVGCEYCTFGQHEGIGF